MLAGYALLGSTWLIMKTEGYLQQWAYKITLPLLLAVLVVFGIIGVWTPFVDEMVRERWFSNLSIIWVLPVLTLLCAIQIYRSVRDRRDGMPFVATMGLFITTYLGLVVSRWPYVVPPEYTLWEAASAYESQLFLLLGLLFVLAGLGRVLLDLFGCLLLLLLDRAKILPGLLYVLRYWPKYMGRTMKNSSRLQPGYMTCSARLMMWLTSMILSVRIRPS